MNCGCNIAEPSSSSTLPVPVPTTAILTCIKTQQFHSDVQCTRREVGRMQLEQYLAAGSAYAAVASGCPAAFQPSMKTAADSGDVMMTQSKSDTPSASTSCSLRHAATQLEFTLMLTMMHKACAADTTIPQSLHNSPVWTLSGFHKRKLQHVQGQVFEAACHLPIFARFPCQHNIGPTAGVSHACACEEEGPHMNR